MNPLPPPAASCSAATKWAYAAPRASVPPPPHPNTHHTTPHTNAPPHPHPSCSVATKWDVTKGEYRNKRRLELGPKAEARAHWSISYSLPAIEGWVQFISLSFLGGKGVGGA